MNDDGIFGERSSRTTALQRLQLFVRQAVKYFHLIQHSSCAPFSPQVGAILPHEPRAAYPHRWQFRAATRSSV